MNDHTPALPGKYRAGVVPALFWILLFPVVPLAFAARADSSGAKTVFIVNQDPSFLAVVDATGLRILRQIPVAPNVTGAAVGAGGKYVYLLHSGRVAPAAATTRVATQRKGGGSTATLPSEQSSLSVVDTEGSTVKRVPLGWNVQQLLLPEARDRVLCLGVSDAPPGDSSGSSQSAARRPANPERGRANPFSLRSMGVNISGLESWLTPLPATQKARALTAYLTEVDAAKDHPASSAAVGPAGTRVAISGDRGSVYVLRMPVPAQPVRGRLVLEKDIRLVLQARTRERARLLVFPWGSTQPSAEIPLEGWPRMMRFSPDGRYLYLWDPGLPGATQPGSSDRTVQVVDTRSHQLVATHKVEVKKLTAPLILDTVSGEVALLGDHPEKKKAGVLYRIRGPEIQEVRETAVNPKCFVRPEGYPGRILVTQHELCVSPDGFPARTSCAIVNPETTESASTASGPRTKTLDAWPEEVIYLPSQHRFLLKAGGRVGLLDVEANHLAQVVSTGRTSVKIGQVVGSVIGAAALSFGMTAAMGAIAPGSLFIAVPLGPGAGAHALRVQPQERVAYALNGGTEDITVIDTSSGKAGKKIGVGGECSSIELSGDGRRLAVLCSTRIVYIDTATARRLSDVRLGRLGAMKDFHEIKRMNRAFILADRGVLVLDTGEGKAERELEGVTKPTLIVE